VPLAIKIIAVIDCVFGLFILGWFLKMVSSMEGFVRGLWSSCPCTILVKILVLLVGLITLLFIKSGVQIFQLKIKGRDDHISFSSMMIFILFFPLMFSSRGGVICCTSIISGLLITYLAWSIFYLKKSSISNLFDF